MLNNSVKKKTLSGEIIKRIRAHIIQNSLKEGDRLPTEQEMAEAFGVSRIIIREATKALGFFGIINSAPRRGLTVGSVDMKRIADILAFQLAIADYPKEILLKSRMVIEIGSLQYASAILNQDKKLHAELISICDKIDSITNAEEFIREDARFHQTLVEASGIEPLVAFNDVLQIFFKKFRQRIINHPEGWSIGSKVHRQIIESLKSGNITQAEDLLREHLEAYKEDL